MKRPLLYLLLGAGLREHDHADRAVAARTLVPGDEERAVVEVGLGREDRGHLRRQPGVAKQHAITLRAGNVLVHVVAEVRDDEVVARDGREWVPTWGSLSVDERRCGRSARHCAGPTRGA